MKTRETKVNFRTYGEISLPEGLHCRHVPTYPSKDQVYFWLDELPESIFPKNSMIRHDAIYYGVWLTENDVQDVSIHGKTGE